MLYSYFRSSSAHRVRIALNIKGVDYEYKAINLIKEGGGEQHSVEYKKLNPKGEVPFFLDGDRGIGQSMAIALYLDEKFPGPKLFPKDPYMKCFCIQQCEIINSGIQPFHNLKVLKELKKRFQISEDDKNSWVKFWIEEGLSPLELILKPISKNYSLGDDLSALDAFIIPQVFTCMRYNISLINFPTIKKIFDNCQNLPAFQKAEPSKQPDFIP
ncbi:MAG: maleylacetoacetate isomerase [Bacteriovoracales bacterium]